ENLLWKTLQEETAANKKKILFRTYQSIAKSKGALDALYAIWKEQKPPVGVALSEDDYTSLALNLAVKEYPVATILDSQLVRITNPDRKQRLQFIMPAASADVNVRDAFFSSLKNQKTRKKEAWVADALSYLHHPLRAATSIHYLKQSLDMLQEIQATGDIFFPGAWLSATFGSYQTTEAANVVRAFLKTHPDYNQKLKAKILQSADPLFRAEGLVK
ncbi:MAG: aminopeptidase, partial [Bacteroidota bacterium]|nr:aminopeptidase [Bacteroidota bacterium]